MKTDLESQEAGAPFGRGAWGPPARGRPLPIGENRSESMQKSGRPFIGGPPMKDSSLPIGAERSESMQKAGRPFIGGLPMKDSSLPIGAERSESMQGRVDRSSGGPR